MKGIILAGGKGSRLYPVTQYITKQLIPLYNKPMIYYPLSVLMLTGIKDILIISTSEDIPKFKQLFGNGNHLGLNISYTVQERPEGLAQSFILGETFIKDDSVALILGDNFFYGQNFIPILRNISLKKEGATILCYKVKNPENFGVIEFDKNFKALSIEEKPSKPKSNYAVTGLYFYDNNVVEYAKSLKPSARGELEITDINKLYLDKNQLNIQLLGRGFAWLDTGTHEAILEASHFIQTIEKRQGFKIACIEEIAYNMGYIDKEHLTQLAESYKNNEYGEYLQDIIQGNYLKIN